jgi:hypothetical protein
MGVEEETYVLMFYLPIGCGVGVDNIRFDFEGIPHPAKLDLILR